MHNLLLIDDDPWEREFVKDMCTKVLKSDFRLHYVKDLPDALNLLDEKRFDLIMLDNILSPAINAKRSMPKIKEKSGDSPIAIISNDTSVDYLNSPAHVGADHVIEKAKLPSFLKLFQSMLN
jgi:DNA-binding response OmpR family regulator